MAHAAAPGTSTGIRPLASQSSQANNVDQPSTPPNPNPAQSNPRCKDHVVRFQLEVADSPSPNPSPAETTPSPNSSTSANPNHPTTKPTMISSSTRASKTFAQVRLGASQTTRQDTAIASGSSMSQLQVMPVEGNPGPSESAPLPVAGSHDSDTVNRASTVRRSARSATSARKGKVT